MQTLCGPTGCELIELLDLWLWLVDWLVDTLPFLTWWFYGCLAALALTFFFLLPMPGERDDVGGWTAVLGLGAILGLALWLSFGGGEGGGKATAPGRESIPQYSAQKDREGRSGGSVSRTRGCAARRSIARC